MAKYFITGIGGFIGLELCRQLLERGHRVSGIVHKNVPPELTEMGVNLLQADLLDTGAYSRALEECEYLVHLAGNPKFGNGKQYEAENVATTQALLEVTKNSAKRLQRFIFISTIGAVDRAASDVCKQPLDEEAAAHPSSDYGRSKQRCEELISRAGVPYTIIRPTLVVGSKMRYASHVSVFSRQALQRKLFSRLDWPGQISVIHVADLVGAIIAVAETPAAVNQVYFAAGEKVAIGRIMKLTNPSLKQVSIQWLAVLIQPIGFVLPFSLKALLYPALTASDEKLKRIGWHCSVPLSDALQEVMDREKARTGYSSAPKGWALVSGAASGLGQELAKILNANGRKLIALDRDEKGLQELLPGEKDIVRITADLADWESTEAKLKSQLSADIRVGVSELFLCAGFGLRGEIGKLPAKNQAEMFQVNVLSRLQLARYFLPQMINNQFGRIVYISSSSAYQPLPFMGVYAASNAAVLSMGEALAYENKDNGVEVLTVCPGGMATNFQKSAGVKEIEGEKLMSAHDAAQIIMASLGKQKIVLMPGLRSFMMSLAARMLPRRISLYLWGKLMALAR